MSSDGLCLLSLDGGGVRGLSSLYILREIMVALNHARTEAGLSEVKPCEVFDLIGGTSTGGLIAIMLGRLEMDVDECIQAYTTLSGTIFSKRESKFSIGLNGNIKAKFSSKRLREAIESIMNERGVPPDEAFDDGETDKSRGCRVFVCSCDRANKDIVRLKSYDIPGRAGPMRPPSIIEAALATSAAPTFFDSVDVDNIIYLDGALGANNPVKQVASEAADIWFPKGGDPDLQANVKCFISIGTGHPGVNPVRDDKALRFLSATLKELATDTEKTAMEFADYWRGPLQHERYFRFNVQHGLDGIGLEEYKKTGEIQSMTRSYMSDRQNRLKVEQCVEAIKDKRNSQSTQLELYHPQRFERISKRWAIWFDRKLCDDIFHRISDYDPEYQLRSIIAERCPQTTQWILASQEYKAWKESRSGYMWLTGKIGSGKTFISSTVIEDLCHTNFVGHYFVQPMDPTKLAATDLFRSYAFQLIAFLDQLQVNYPRDIVSSIIRHFGPKASFPSLHHITQDIFFPLCRVSVTDKNIRCFYVIDGLDAFSQPERTHVLQIFKDLSEFLVCHIFISTRDNLKHHIDTKKDSIIHLSDDHTRQDIRTFIEWKVERKRELEDLPTNDPKLLLNIIEVLNKKAHLMILWVSLQIEAIWTCACDSEIRKRIEDLPDDLTDTYRRCASRLISPLGPRVLSYVCATITPFYVEELQSVLAIDSTTGKLHQENVPHLKAIMMSCAGLITRSFDEKIVPTHHSTVLFLEREEALPGLTANKYDEGLVRLEMGSLLVKHLSGPDYALSVDRRQMTTHHLAPDTFVRNPMLPGLSWWNSWKKPAKTHALTMPSDIISYGSPPNRAFAFARKNWAHLNRQISPRSSSWSQFAQLVLRKDFSWYVHPWDPLGMSLDSHYQGVLGWAIAESHEPMLRVIIGYSNPKPRTEIFLLPLPQYNNKTPLEIAMQKKDLSIFNQVLPYYMVNEDVFSKAHLLIFAAKVGFTAIVDQYRDNGWSLEPSADEKIDLITAQRLKTTYSLPKPSLSKSLEVQCENLDYVQYHVAALEIAILYTNLDFLRKFCSSIKFPKYGPSNPHRDFNRIFHTALEQPDDEALHILLEAGALPSSDTLELLVPSVKLSSMRLFLKYGAARHISPDNQLQVLYKALANDDIESLRIILDQSLILNLDSPRQRDHKGIFWEATPLMWASICSSATTIECLLARSVDVNARNRDQETAALVMFNYSLINHTTGASIHDSPVRQRQILELLHRHGADLNAKDKDGTTVLMRAARNHDEYSLQYLIDCGVDPFCQTTDTRQWNALSFALRAAKGQNLEHVINTLVDLGLPLQEDRILEHLPKADHFEVMRRIHTIAGYRGFRRWESSLAHNTAEESQ